MTSPRSARARAPILGALLIAAVLIGAACGGGDRQPRATRPDITATAAPREPSTPSAADVPLHRGANGLRFIETPGFPHGVNAGFGSIWVEGHRGGAVYRIDPRSNRVTATIDIGQALCLAPRFGGGVVWISTCGGGPTVRIDPATNRAGETFYRGYGGIYGAGSLWTASEDGLLRLDPRSGVELTAIDPRLDTSAYWWPIAVARGSVWVYATTAVSRIDTNTNRVTAVIPLPGSQRDGDYAGGYSGGGMEALAHKKLWVTNPAGLYEIDPSTNTARLHRLRIRPFSEIGDIYVSAAKGDLFVRVNDSEVARFDPATGSVVGHEPTGGGGGGGLTAAFGALWISNAAKDRLARRRLSSTP